MSQAHKDCVNPWQAATRGQVFQREIPIAEMTRLAPALLATDGVAKIEVTFTKDEHRRAILTGHIQCGLTLKCQRCMEKMLFPLVSDFQLAFVRSQAEENELPEEYDPYEVIEEQVCLLDIVEDEILLSLPQVAMHDPSECAIQTKFGEQIEEEPEKENPFAVLASLKTKN